MTNQITVITDSTGTKAWTVNPLGEKPEEPKLNCFPNAYEGSVIGWQQAESERKCYEVENRNTVYEDEQGITRTKRTWSPNTRYLAEIADENTVRIIKEI